MDRTVLAGRLLLERTAQATLEGIRQKAGTLRADRVLVELQSVQSFFGHGQDAAGSCVMSPAVDRGEHREDPEVLELAASERLRGALLIHNFILAHSAIARLDTRQGHKKTACRNRRF
jgi:hypothetical protein